jgi:drug/metabolite transporter (DMT)-like permease
VLGALTLVQIFFGLHYLAAKTVLEHVPPRAWAALRVAAAAAVLLGAARLFGAAIPRSRGDIKKLTLYAVFGVVINQICFVEGLARTTPIHSSLVNTTIPVGTLIFAALLGKERVVRSKLVSIAVSLAGVLFVIRPSPESLAGGQFAGDLLTLANAMSYSFFLVISKDYLTQKDALGATATLLTLGAIGVAVLGASEVARLDFAKVPARVIWLGAFIVVFATAGAYLLNYWALARVESSFVALFIYLQPVLATGMSALLRGERLTLTDAAGGGLIFAGVYLAAGPRRLSAGRPAHRRAGPDGPTTRPPAAGLPRPGRTPARGEER